MFSLILRICICIWIQASSKIYLSDTLWLDLWRCACVFREMGCCGHTGELRREHPISSSEQSCPAVSCQISAVPETSKNVEIHSKIKKTKLKPKVQPQRVWGDSMSQKRAPPPLNPLQPVLYIECCRAHTDYRRRATELHASLADALRTLQPDMQLQLRLNENDMPRLGSFEVAIAATPTEDVQERQVLWTGLERVPVSAKVPHVDDIIAPACIALKLRHSQAGSSNINLVRTSDGDITKILQRRNLQ